MRDVMDWDYCKRNFIKNVSIDHEKIASIIETAESRLRYIKQTKVNKNNVSFVVEGYYEVIKELLVALLLSHGLRSKNHQCLISFLYNKFEGHDVEVNLISQMSFLRNRLDYYGENIDLGFYEKNKNEFGKIIKLLKELIK